MLPVLSRHPAELRCSDRPAHRSDAESHPWHRHISGAYDRFVSIVGRALNRQGIAVSQALPGDMARGRSPVCFERDAGETLLLNNKKVLGCAQRRTQRAVLVHGALLLDLDVPLHCRVFDVPESRIRAVMTHLPPCRPDELAASIAEETAKSLDLSPEWRNSDLTASRQS